MHFDPTMFTTFFGCHIKACEANEIVKEYNEVTDKEIDIAKANILGFFDTTRSCVRSHLDEIEG